MKRKEKETAFFKTWLEELRKEAESSAGNLPLPEDKYNRRKIPDFDSLPLPHPRKDATTRIPEKAGDFEIIEIDGSFLKISSEGKASREGVLTGDEKVNVPPHFQEVLSHWKDEILGAHRLTRKIFTLPGAVTVIYVPPNANFTDSIDILHVRSADNPLLSHLTFIFADTGSKARIFEEYVFESDREGGALAGTFIFLREGAELEYNCLFPATDLPMSSLVKKAFLDKDSKLRWAYGWFGSRYMRADIAAFLDGSGSEVNEHHLFFGADSQFYDLDARLIHTSPSTRGKSSARGALAGSSRCVFRALVKIERDAKDAESLVEDHVILLSPKARSDARPALEILNNDVRASHSASSSHLDPEKLFYLTSRGLPEKEAREVFIKGFFDSLLSGSWQSFRLRIAEQTEKLLERSES